MIELCGIRKTFLVARRDAGFKNAAKAMFHREYERINALDGISFKIGDGEMVGYIGPNGAGKSSTIKVMSGILTPTSGECVINGRIPWKQRREHVREIGVVFGQRSQLWWDVPVVDSFELLRDIYSVDEKQFKSNLDELTELLELETIIKTPARQLSLGQRMRCEIAASLLHSPKILFLDEPTIGLDAVSKLAVRSFVRKINRERKTTVILTTHDMQDIEALTDRILLIGRGKILLDGRLDELKQRFSTHKLVTLTFADEIRLPDSLPDGVSLKESTHGRLTLDVDSEKAGVAGVISHFDSDAIRDVSVSQTPIDEIVVRLYKENMI